MTSQNGDKPKPFTVHDLIKCLESFDPDLPVLVRLSEPIHNGEDDQIDYWQVTKHDVIRDYVVNCKTGKEYSSVLIGDDRV